MDVAVPVYQQLKWLTSTYWSMQNCMGSKSACVSSFLGQIACNFTCCAVPTTACVESLWRELWFKREKKMLLCCWHWGSCRGRFAFQGGQKLLLNPIVGKEGSGFHGTAICFDLVSSGVRRLEASKPLFPWLVWEVPVSHKPERSLNSRMQPFGD